MSDPVEYLTEGGIRAFLLHLNTLEANWDRMGAAVVTPQARARLMHILDRRYDSVLMFTELSPAPDGGIYAEGRVKGSTGNELLKSIGLNSIVVMFDFMLDINPNGSVELSIEGLNSIEEDNNECST